jgi:hypothetical protein
MEIQILSSSFSGAITCGGALLKLSPLQMYLLEVVPPWTIEKRADPLLQHNRMGFRDRKQKRARAHTSKPKRKDSILCRREHLPKSRKAPPNLITEIAVTTRVLVNDKALA